MNILIGADPELFVKREGVLKSAFGLIPGTKEAPHPVNKGAVQVDGMALEFNIHPASNEEEFCSNINDVIRQMSEMVPEFELVNEPVAYFGDAVIKEQPPEARELGCEPDFNAWLQGAENPIPDVETPFRTAAGHIHIGWTEGEDAFSTLHVDMCCKLVKALDLFLGVPFVLFDTNMDRRSLYGKAGAMRPKPYGVEYRTLSNKWVGNEEVTRWIYRTVNKVIKLLTTENLTADDVLIEECINTGDTALADYLIARYNLEVPECFGQI